VETTKTLTFSKLRVGIFVLIGLAVLGFLIMNSSGDFNPFEKKMHLKARFAAADGLREGSEVQLAGVRIGKVEKVTLLPPDSPEDFKIEAVMVIGKELNESPITERIRTTNKRKLIWLTGFITFLLSAVLDNLTTTIVMVSLLRKIVPDHRTRLLYAGLVVIAANAGGAWSPIGDVTTTMLWIGGQISATSIITKTFLPSLISFVIPALILSGQLKGNFEEK